MIAEKTFSSQKYAVNQHLIETLLSWVKSGEIVFEPTYWTLPSAVNGGKQLHKLRSYHKLQTKFFLRHKGKA